MYTAVEHFHLYFALLTLATPQLMAQSDRVLQVQLQINSCVDVDYAKVGHLVANRLMAQLVGQDAQATALKVSVGCLSRFLEVRVESPDTNQAIVSAVEPKPYVELRVDDPLTGKTLKRAIDFENAPALHRARLLGIAITELVSASLSELVTNPNPEVAPVGRRSSPGLQGSIRRQTADSGGSAWFFAPSSRLLSRTTLNFFGGTIGLEQRFSNIFGWGWQTAALFAKIQRKRNKLYLATTDFTLFGFAHWRQAIFDLSAALGWRTGLTAARGQSGAVQLQEFAPSGGPTLQIRATVELTPMVSLFFVADSGHAVWDVKIPVPGAKAVELGGFSAGGSAGLILAL